MKKKLLLLAVAMLSVLGASAQWVKPEVKTLDPVSVANDGALVRIYNVEYGAFLGGANAWGTQTSLIEEGLDYKLEWAENGKDFKLLTSSGAKAGKYLFRDNESGCFIDMGSQNKGFNWTIAQAESGFYTIQSPLDDTAYGTEMYDDAADQFFGWNGDKNIVYANVRVDGEDVDGNPLPCGIEWAFMSTEDAAALAEALVPYNAAMELKAEIDKAKADYPKVDVSEAEAVFNNTNSTVEELNAAKATIANAIAALRSQEVLAGATADNPIDGTELIENADFSTGDISGWTCTFVSGTTATNVGYQGASYNGLEWSDEDTGDAGTATLNKFIEAWANNVNEMKRDGKTFATIGDAKLCQTIYGLPAGKYKLSANVNAVQQYDASQNPVTGVQLYVTAGEIDSYMDMATGNGVPEHFILTFIHTGGTVELGLRTSSTTANWIAADDFHLMYYGEINENPYQEMLKDYIVSVENKYADMDEIAANTQTKDAFEAALDAAKDAADNEGDEYYQNLQASLTAAVSELAASVEAYKSIAKTIEEADARISETDGKWGDLADIISEKVEEWNEKYDNGQFSNDDAAAIDAELNNIIADYVSANVQEGDDVTILLKNPAFTTNFSGWTTTGTSPVWGANFGNGVNVNAELNQEAPEEKDGLAERWRASFDMFQTIKNMPRGLYTLSVQGYNRDELGGNPAELYAVLPDSTEQIAHFHDINDYLTDDQLYATADGAWPSDKVVDGRYSPDSMSGAAWHFKNKSDGENYDYMNEFNIVMTEAGDLTVGVRCDNAGQWVIFDNFRITYKGSGAEVYKKPIEQKIAEGDRAIEDGQTYQDSEFCGASAEVLTAWGKTVDAAYAAETEEACIQALNNLENGIKAIKASIELAHKVHTAVISAETRQSNEEIDDDELSNLIGEIEAKLYGEGFASDAEMEAAIIDLDIAFCKAAFNAVDVASASEDTPANITGVIANAKYTNIEGTASSEMWTSDRGFGWIEGADEEGNSYNVAEVWNATFATSQKIYLPAGFYRLKVKGFQRGYGFNKHSEMCVDSLGNDVPEHLPAKLYAGDTKTSIISLFDNISFEDSVMVNKYEGEGATVAGGKYDGAIVPNNMAQSAAAFGMGLYENILQFEVTGTEAFNAIEIGILKETNENDAWVIWGDWRLEYVGSTKPATDPTTDIQSVASQVVAAQYFNVNGVQQSRLQKGVNIVKVTRADGTSKMVKVLVK